MDLFNKRSKALEEAARPRSRTMPNIVREKLSSRFTRAEPQLEISLPTNFQHNVKVSKKSDGTFEGMPEEWLSVLLTQVAVDRENGDSEAAEAGARVLKFFQDFSRDGSRSKKKLKAPIGAPGSQAPKLSHLKKLESPLKSSTFYLSIEPGTPPAPKPRMLDLVPPNNYEYENQVQDSEKFYSVVDGEDQFECLELPEAQKAMAEAILELKHSLGEKPSSFKRQTFRPAKPHPIGHLNVQLRPESVSSSDETSTQLGRAAYRNVSLYSNEEAFAEMKKLCNSIPVEKVYTQTRRLGSGSGGVVFQGVHNKTKDRVAIKTIDLNSGEKKVHLLMEVQVMRELVHPNLVSFLDIFVTDTELSVVMEFVDAGALTDIVLCTILSELQMASICREVLKGLGYLHEHEVVHRDIKSDNILLSLKGAVKITDFGFAANVAGNRMRKTFAGTPYWMAPEIINKNTYSTKVDVWSTGILAMEMLDGNPPYMNETPMKAMYLISKKGQPPITSDTISTELRSFLDFCLRFDPAKRATVKELLEHKFMAKAGNMSCIVPNIKATIQKKKGLI